MPSRSSHSAKEHGNRLATRVPLLAAATLAFVAVMAVGLSTARPARAASPTVQPFQPGRHVYDNGLVLSAHSAQTAETLAAHIESMGGGRVAIYTAPDSTGVGSVADLAAAWYVDGLLLTGSGDFGQLNEGATLKAKLTADQLKAIDSSPGMSTLESWMLSTLARIDGFRQVNPAADQSTLDDPVWMFTVEVSLAGQAPFPAIFGHRVPREKVAAIGPGIKLAVAVNPANRNQEVAIDWNQSPLMS